MRNSLPTSRFLFVRHGQTVWNHERRYAGSSEVALSDAAAEQISHLTAFLKKVPVDAIYSSPLSRCIITITETAHYHHRRIIVREELRERDLGKWEGKTPREIHPNHPGYHFPDSAYNGEFLIPQAETLDHLEHRVRGFIQEIHQAHPGQTVVVATHAGIIWMLQARIVANRPHQVKWPGNCSVSTVVTQEGHYLWGGTEEEEDLVHYS